MLVKFKTHDQDDKYCVKTDNNGIWSTSSYGYFITGKSRYKTNGLSFNTDYSKTRYTAFSTQKKKVVLADTTSQHGGHVYVKKIHEFCLYVCTVVSCPRTCHQATYMSSSYMGAIVTECAVGIREKMFYSKR